MSCIDSNPLLLFLFYHVVNEGLNIGPIATCASAALVEALHFGAKV